MGAKARGPKRPSRPLYGAKYMGVRLNRDEQLRMEELLQEAGVTQKKSTWIKERLGLREKPRGDPAS